MDCLFAKYGSPFLFIDGMIQTHRLSEFVDEFLKIENEDRKWEFYLHKVYDKSFEEWNKSIPKAKEDISDEQLETTIQDSKSILTTFIPEN